jgi:hypothetical protein
VDVIHFAREAWPYLLVGAPGVWAVYKQWTARQDANRKDRGDLVKIAQDAAGAVIQDLRDEGDRLQKRVDSLEAELSAVRKEHSETVAAKDAKILMLEGQLRQALAAADAFDRLLTANDIPHSPPTRPYFELDGGEVHSLGAPV